MKIKRLVYLILCVSLSGCSGCSKSAQKYKNRDTSRIRTERYKLENSRTESRVRAGRKTIVKMVKKNGVYYVPIEVNGTKMDFIFDTGAGIISISETEAMFLLKQGTLTEDDIIGKSQFSDANGDISEGTIINLKTVKMGSTTLKNIEASVVPNSVAPLLLGQSAFEKFGKISIDYKKGEITLE